MCGIAGYVSREPFSFSSEAIWQSMAHRGPNNRGEWSSNQLAHSVHLWHTRLSILDLSAAGNQPMLLINRFALVFNGEIYNYRELSASHLPGIVFRSGTDTEVLLHLWSKFGPDCLPLLNGDFALCVCDLEAGTVTLARDRYGVKPLFYSEISGRLAFASETQTLMQLGVPEQTDYDAFLLYLLFKYVPGDRTLNPLIRSLKPGSWLQIDLRSGVTRQEQWYRRNFAPGTYNGSSRDAFEEIRHLLGESVHLRTHADVAVCNLLSGGVDSTIIASHLTHNKEVTHFIAVKDTAGLRAEGTTSDADYARLVCRQWELTAHEVFLPHALLADKTFFNEAARPASPDLIADGSVFPLTVIAREASHTCRVALTGMGADELFLGYAGHQLVRLWNALMAMPVPVQQLVLRVCRSMPVGPGPFQAIRRWLRKMSAQTSHRTAHFGFSVVGETRAVFKLHPRAEEVWHTFLEPYCTPSADRLLELFAFEADNFLVKNLAYTDRTCMQYSLEARVPFLDYRLVDFCDTLRIDWRITDRGTTKAILKEAYRGIVPDSVLFRRKAGFGMPFRSYFSNQQHIDQWINPEFLAQHWGLNRENIVQIAREHTSGKADHSALIWALGVAQAQKLAQPTS